MILLIDLPEGAKLVETEEGRRLVVELDQKRHADLWQHAMYVWLVAGEKAADYPGGKLHATMRVEVTNRNKLKGARLK